MGQYGLRAGLIIVIVSPLPGAAQTIAPTVPADDSLRPICSMIEVTAARLNALPVDLFGRLIWQESRVQPELVGPLGRSGAHAEGIAQFMPDTAVERGLFEPFNPVKTLAKSGAFPAALRDEFGNLELATAAYGHVCFTLKIGGTNETTNLSLQNPTAESLAYLNLPKPRLPLLFFSYRDC